MAMKLPGMGPGMGLPGMGAAATPGGVPADKHQLQSSELYKAAEHNDLSTAQKALAEGADVNVSNLQGVTPLLLAVKNLNTNMVNLLLKSSADPNKVSADSSPVHEAVKRKSAQILEILLNAKGNINLQADFGKTPLHMAIQGNTKDIIDVLLKRNADYKAKTQSGVTCLHFACAEGDKDMVQKFLNMGLNINEQNGNGKSPLHIAAEKNHLDVIKTLLMANANTKLKDSWGREACECGQVTAYRTIKEHKPGMKYEFVTLTEEDLKEMREMEKERAQQQQKQPH
jgi:ankyrin repeat protein